MHIARRILERPTLATGAGDIARKLADGGVLLPDDVHARAGVSVVPAEISGEHSALYNFSEVVSNLCAL